MPDILLPNLPHSPNIEMFQETFQQTNISTESNDDTDYHLQLPQHTTNSSDENEDHYLLQDECIQNTEPHTDAVQYPIENYT